MPAPSNSRRDQMAFDLLIALTANASIVGRATTGKTDHDWITANIDAAFKAADAFLAECKKREAAP